MREAVYSFMDASHAFDQARSKLDSNLASPLLLRMFNDQMVQIEKAFISSSMLSSNNVQRHIFSSPGKPFPGIWMAYTAGNINEMKRQMSLVVKAISSAANILKPLPTV
ncbi:Glutamate carboxypeptidase 2 [Desmophyllum pertusum]|uniref:Glutamate carboxypeptidase 2 n=1 Tax=Desmophyllum pertusum TaxID=174260 RepID=A0A9W9ZGJ7_9CNID|nr:Glutamate carboxypeptidase 2 [Desmophyllum pertusum]